MEKIRLPEDFTDRVMQKIEQRERAAARRTRIITVCGSILGAVFVIAAAVAVLDYFNISLNSLTIDLPRLDIPGAVSGFISSVSDIMRKVITTPSSPLLGIVLAVFTLAFAGLWHDRRHRQDITTSVK
ncbi:MAG TPA: hypothetical protein IAC94_07120 [Candidatus Coprenecus avistercoris]|uniref:Uncharacterized protein n=1 Tax=Candidatus Coprenecus avistercoris TaxID=2840730 RepID=A0A9D1E218_9BACT|nr:hypothetical protein [Candidatus Coprenecus avistercoris]